MSITIRVAILVAVACTIVGCEPPARSTPVGTAPPPPPVAGAGISFAEPPITSMEGEPVAAENGVAVGGATDSRGSIRDPQPSARDLQPPSKPAPSSPASESPAAIQLSSGVALPQLLPDGTQIGVSVDYRVRGKLNGSASYFLVVTSSEGEVAFPVELSAGGGTLQGFCPPAVRPEHKPFTARIEEQSPASRSRTTISNRAMLATSY